MDRHLQTANWQLALPHQSSNGKSEPNTLSGLTSWMTALRCRNQHPLRVETGRQSYPEFFKFSRARASNRSRNRSVP